VETGKKLGSGCVTPRSVYSCARSWTAQHAGKSRQHAPSRAKETERGSLCLGNPLRLLIRPVPKFARFVISAPVSSCSVNRPSVPNNRFWTSILHPFSGWLSRFLPRRGSPGGTIESSPVTLVPGGAFKKGLRPIGTLGKGEQHARSPIRRRRSPTVPTGRISLFYPPTRH
jgi:hypothetical protein